VETPPLRTFLFLITFLAVFGLIVTTIPYEFIVASEEYKQQEIPTEEFRLKDLQAYASTMLIPMNETGGKDYVLLGFDTDMYYVSVTIGGHKCAFIYSKANQTEHNIFFYHSYTVYLIFPTWHRLKWTNAYGQDRGDYLTASELESDYADNLPYNLACSHFQMDGSFNYNETTYSSVEDAWDHYGLDFCSGIEFDQMATGLNAWDLIGMVLFFKIPNIHPIFNYMIAVPIWVSIVWLSVALIIAFIKALPFT